MRLLSRSPVLVALLWSMAVSGFAATTNEEVSAKSARIQAFHLAINYVSEMGGKANISRSKQIALARCYNILGLSKHAADLIGNVPLTSIVSEEGYIVDGGEVLATSNEARREWAKSHALIEMASTVRSAEGKTNGKLESWGNIFRKKVDARNCKQLDMERWGMGSNGVVESNELLGDDLVGCVVNVPVGLGATPEDSKMKIQILKVQELIKHFSRLGKVYVSFDETKPLGENITGFVVSKSTRWNELPKRHEIRLSKFQLKSVVLKPGDDGSSDVTWSSFEDDMLQIYKALFYLEP